MDDILKDFNPQILQTTKGIPEFENASDHTTGGPDTDEEVIGGDGW